MADAAEPDNPQGAADTAQAARVFISYASQDKGVADAVCQALEKAGVACWIAPRDVVLGGSYAGEIVHAIDATRLLILILSKNSVESKHVLREVERASSKGHSVVGFKIDMAPISADLEYFLNTSQWLDASGTGVERALPRLIDAVQRVISSSGNAAVAQGPLAAPSQQTPVSKSVSRRPRLLILAVSVLVALAFAYFAVDKLWLAKRSATEQPTTAATSVVSDKSIAVLPFTDMSEKHDQEYFGDGMAEEILDLLAKIPGLTVIGRTSSFQFKGKNEDLRTIGAKLNAAYVLEGSVRKSGDQVRITAQLINTRTGAHEWSETYDRHIGDVLKLQDAIAAAVVRELQLTVAPDYLSPRSTLKDTEAYDLYLRGRHAADRWDQDGFDESVMLFQQALDRDPTFVEAAAALAWTYEFQGEFGFVAPVVAFEKARRETATALKLDPKNLEAHAVLAGIHTVYDWDWAAALREIQQVETLTPGNANLLGDEAILSFTLGRWDEALRQIKAALSKDPLNPSFFVILFSIEESRGHLPEAEAAIRRVLDIRPTYDSAHYYLGLLQLERGDRDAALAEMQQETDAASKQEGLAMVYYALERKAESDAVLAGMLKDQTDTDALGIAEVYAFRGQSDEAMHWLERAYAQKDAELYAIKGNSVLHSLVGDPGYKAFLKKMNLPE
ncbi:MAG: TIR domain-containing protein [Candidatus Korobacteraceae bacterium]